MGKKARELTATEVKLLTQPGLHAVGVVPGLYLKVPKPEADARGSVRTARIWILRVTVAGKRREMGLGGYPAVTLAQAHAEARKRRAEIGEGVDPVESRRRARSELRAAQAAALTFEQCATKYIAAQRSAWSNPRHLQQWTNSLAQHVYPVIGGMLVRDVSLPQVLAVLEPIWEITTETASRVRGRIERVLDWAAARGYREGPNPARWRGNLEALLPKPGKIAKVQHHRALAVNEIGAFMRQLRAAEGTGALALEFAILTAARSGEVRGAEWSEIDKDAGLWIVPAARMKAKREHRVPLSRDALAVLERAAALPRLAGSEFIFAAPRGGALSDMTLLAVLRRLGVDAVPHGFRSTFRDWAAERTNYPGDMAEMALAHTINSKVEAAYRRGDMVEKRRMMMSDWAAFLAQPEASGTVAAIGRAKA